jgi:hypothetical protein
MTSGAEKFGATLLDLVPVGPASGGYAPVRVQDPDHLAQQQMAKDE